MDFFSFNLEWTRIIGSGQQILPSICAGFKMVFFMCFAHLYILLNLKQILPSICAGMCDNSQILDLLNG